MSPASAHSHRNAWTQ